MVLRKSQGSQWQGLRGGGEKENIWNIYIIYKRPEPSLRHAHRHGMSRARSTGCDGGTPVTWGTAGQLLGAVGTGAVGRLLAGRGSPRARPPPP